MWKVMAADDEIYIQEALKNLISWEKMGCVLHSISSNGKELLERMETEHPDIVITDIRMPLVDGLEVCKYISENSPETQVIILSAHSEFEYARAALRYNACEYVLKLSVLEELPQAVEKAILNLKRYYEEIEEGEKSEEGRNEIEFDTLQTRFLTPGEGEKLKTLGFMNEDLVYGMIKQEDILKDKNGKTTEGIHTVKIEDFAGNVKKEYKKDGLYITNVTIGDTLMEFQLSAKGESGYTFKKKDNIMNNKKAAASQVSVELTSANRTGTLVRLAFEEKPAMDKPLVMASKMRSIENNPVTLETQIPDENVYYVYAKGGLEGVYRNPAQAVKRADAKTGVVLNQSQQYVWERGNKKTKLQLNIQDIPEVIRTGSWDKNKLQEGLGETGTVIDLSGCSLDSVLYEVSAQRAVVAKTGSDTSAVIVGYDEYNTWLYDPATGETKPYGMNDSTELFQKAGNVFISYVEKPGY